MKTPPDRHPTDVDLSRHRQGTYRAGPPGISYRLKDDSYAGVGHAP